MIIFMPTTRRPQQRYDQRRRAFVQHTGDVTAVTLLLRAPRCRSLATSVSPPRLDAAQPRQRLPGWNDTEFTWFWTTTRHKMRHRAFRRFR